MNVKLQEGSFLLGASSCNHSLLFMRARHAGHALLFAPGKRPCGSLHQQPEQELVIQVELVGLQEF